MIPVPAPDGTRASTSVAETLVTVPEAWPLKVTDVVPARPVPWILTSVFNGPLAGVKLVTFGWIVNVAEVLLPPPFATVIGPVTAAEGTMNVIEPAPCLPKIVAFTPAVTPANFTVAPPSVLPVTVTWSPATPLFTESDVIVGLTPIVMLAVPVGVVTVIGPVRAVDGSGSVRMLVDVTLVVPRAT